MTADKKKLCSTPLTLALAFGLILSLSPHSSCTDPGRDKETELDLWIGQMLMVGFRGTELEEDSDFVRQLRQYHIGGTILFDYDVPSKTPLRNIVSREQVAQLTSFLQEQVEIPLLIGVDQEGGRIARFKEARGFPATTSQKVLGALDQEDQTRQNARTIGKLLQSVGININFAPVLDLEVNPENPIIAQLERSFGADPELVVRHARWTIEELHRAGVLSGVKHFPGHGSSRGDSHLGLPDVSEVWSDNELEPFRRLIAENLPDVVMTAHLFNSNWDLEYPATLSHNVVTGLLREFLGFQGVVVSDDMQMAAIVKNFSFEKSIELAILAGVDILVIGNNQDYDPRAAEEAFKVVRKLVEDGKIARWRILESYERITRLKEKLGR